ncbi:glutathione S-transferase [Aspergillus avenaceus]|uniref:Glutathione S-transferase n=1 Tax=Aspergillus avenaceus TaxID=36643 RepID=A0A5N6TJM2_ASPAV|nr:glutathione S-transferase [Aspergillus avenaceus]
MAREAHIYRMTDTDGHFRRKPSAFRNRISRSPDAEFPAEKGRYYLYLSLACPWAQRANIVRSLKGLEDIIPLVLLDHDMGPEGWYFSGRDGTAPKDPLHGFKRLRDLYFHADAEYKGRFTVPMLWDSKKETVVNNESAEIVRMLYTEFDEFLPLSLRESVHPLGGHYPPESSPLRPEIDIWNEWMQDQINNGVYKTGLAGTQAAYNDNVTKLFMGLDRIESHLQQPGHQPYLFGEGITDPDIRLFTTIVRFDVAYYMVFRCSIRTIRHGYPNIDRWMRRLYWDNSEKTRGAFRDTTALHIYKPGYLATLLRNQGFKGEMIVPAGPVPDILPLDEDDDLFV